MTEDKYTLKLKAFFRTVSLTIAIIGIAIISLAIMSNNNIPKEQLHTPTTTQTNDLL